MARKNNPGSASLRGTGKHEPAVSGAAYQQKNPPDNDAIWDACRKSLDADASRAAQADAKLPSAALRLGFAKNENGRWEKQCPGCGAEVGLYTAPNGHVRASGSNPKCGAVPPLQQWLLDEGFQS
jgi:hypothetical protein